MKNPLNSIDKAVMKVIDKSVGDYNKKTGGTKADLSNKLWDVASITTGAGILATLPFPMSIVFAGLWFYATSEQMKSKNNEIYRKEIAAAQEGHLDAYVEDYKNTFKSVGYSLLIPLTALTSLIHFQETSYKTDLGLGLCATGLTVASCATNIMRSSNLHMPKIDLTSRLNNDEIITLMGPLKKD